MEPLAQIRAIAARVAAPLGLEIWDIQSRRETIGHVVRVFIDRPGPAATPEESVSVEDCEQVNREMSTILDVEDPLPFTYTLEVSSPGLDRPLKREDDYRRFVGRLARLSSYEPVDGRRHWAGRLMGLEDGVVAVRLEAEGGAECRIPLAKVAHARLEVEFPKGK
jgi:ribosome maturation factor RimP